MRLGRQGGTSLALAGTYVCSRWGGGGSTEVLGLEGALRGYVAMMQSVPWELGGEVSAADGEGAEG